MNPARLPRLELIAVDATSLVFTLVVSVAAGLAFGAIPVLKHARVRLAEALRAGGRNASASRDRNVTRNTLTIVQVALALVLLIGSGLMIRTFQSMRRVQPGFTDPGDAADAADRHPRRRRRRRCARAAPAAEPRRRAGEPCPGSRRSA